MDECLNFLDQSEFGKMMSKQNTCIKNVNNNIGINVSKDIIHRRTREWNTNEIKKEYVGICA